MLLFLESCSIEENSVAFYLKSEMDSYYFN